MVFLPGGAFGGPLEGVPGVIGAVLCLQGPPRGSKRGPPGPPRGPSKSLREPLGASGGLQRSFVKRNSTIAIIRGNKKNILVAERVALNFLSHISGIATKTNQFVKLAGKKCKICCTRKTIPNLRVIQKYAVKLGGGTNHRFNLSDEFLIKDNHIANSNIRELVSLAIKDKRRKK